MPAKMVEKARDHKTMTHRGYRVAMGEHKGKSFYRARLELESEESARQAEAVTEGLVALGKLRFGDEPGTESVCYVVNRWAAMGCPCRRSRP